MGNQYLIQLVLVCCSILVYCQEDRIKLSEVQVLTLQKDLLTTGRRSAKIPQLKCIGNIYRCQFFAPVSVQCYNKGFDGFDTQWECKSDLDKKVKFGVLKVSCEGYDRTNDPFILAGSCGLEYSLESKRNYYDYYNKDQYETNKLSNFLTLLIMIIIIIAVYKSCNKNRENELRREINTSFAHMGGLDSPMADNYYSNFPPPPPPYGLVVDASSAATVPNLPTLHQPPQPAVSLPPMVPSSSQPPLGVYIKPERAATGVHVNHQTAMHDTSNVAVNAQPVQSSSGWSSFLTGGAVGGVTGFLLSRRNTNTNLPSLPNPSEWPSTSRTESPPPSYVDDEAFSSGFASTTRR